MTLDDCGVTMFQPFLRFYWCIMLYGDSNALAV